MTIHHSIVKQAAGRGVVFAYPDEESVQATHQVSGIAVTLNTEGFDGQNDCARSAWDTAQQIADFNAADGRYKVVQDQDDLDFVATDRAGLDDVARDPSFEDLLYTLALRDEEIDAESNEPDALDVEDDEAAGSVVPSKYKAIYAAAGHPTHCGDWLADLLQRYCRVTDAQTGKETTDIDRLETIANVNDVGPARYGKLGVATNGWQGRFRMTVRNMLVPRVATKGFILIPDGVADGDQEHTAPDEWRASRMPKVKAPKAAGVAKPDAPSGKKGAAKLAKEAGERGITEATKAVRAARAKQEGSPA